MRRLAAIFLLAVPAHAEVGLISRLQDCLGPRAEAQALLVWKNAPCQQDGSCQPFESWRYHDYVYLRCPFEAYGICAADKSGAAECAGQVDNYLNSEIKRIETLFPVERVLASGAGFFRSLAERQAEQVQQAEEVECPPEPDWPLAGLGPELACSRSNAVIRFQRLRAIENSVLHREANE